jgi:methionyl-tRNA formyltransferase
MKIIFFGTPDFVVPVAEELYKKFRTNREKGVIAVVTQPPKPFGRKKLLQYSPIDKWAFDRKIEIHHNYDGFSQADLGVVAAYGRIIPKSVISQFPLGILNIHPSLLPKYRGASPIQSAIAAGETTTGVSVIKMDELMDHGPIVSSFKDEIMPDDTNETLRKRLFERAAEFLIDLIPHYLDAKISLKEQNHDEATFTKIVKKEDGYIKDPFDDPKKTEALSRAFKPWPGIYSKVKVRDKTRRLKILAIHLEDEKLVIDQVQLEGKNPVSWEEFKKGYPNFEFS